MADNLKCIFLCFVIDTLADEILGWSFKIAHSEENAINSIHKKDYISRYGADQIWDHIKIEATELVSFEATD